MAAPPSNAEEGLYPPSAFYFKVVFGEAESQVDTSFQDVSGISSEINTEPVVEGGENRFVHNLPTTVKHANLELKRGIAPLSSPLVTWCKQVMERDFVDPIVPQLVRVYLMDADGNPIRGWSFANAFPVKWETENFNSTKNDVAIEKVVLSYTWSSRLL
ncbi:MAG: phage tail protein [Pseudomonadota bacterium]|nr:phage tail protein [Pseudomonadota bacterium]